MIKTKAHEKEKVTTSFPVGKGLELLLGTGCGQQLITLLPVGSGPCLGQYA